LPTHGKQPNDYKQAAVFKSMKLVVFLNNLGYGGTEKAACRWAWGLKERGHHITMLTLMDGPRRAELEQHNVPVQVVSISPQAIADVLLGISPDAIHSHAPGHPHEGDVLGQAMKLLPRKISVVQTNIFGRFKNPQEDAWTDFRLFVTWTGCVQAARRVFRPLDKRFFRRFSVAVNPLDSDDGPDLRLVKKFREAHGIEEDDVVFGHLGRPDPIRWDKLPIDAFRRALRRNRHLKLLLREPPPEIARSVVRGPDADRFLVLPVTADSEELRLTTAAMDVVLHYSKVGESFGYGIAEPMNLGKPAIVNSTPWECQAQIELVRHGECGFVASTTATMVNAILTLANDPELRERMGKKARQHIRALANPDISIARLETILQAAVEGRDNPFAAEDLEQAKCTATYLDAHQFGYSLLEQLALRPFYYRVRFHQWRKVRMVRS
jgi:glycosyltransferase involved in cell wall biosynthesis